jgi:Tol biopolymer transport system component
MRSTQQTSFDIEMLSLRNPTVRRPLLNSAAYESGARLSPDGHWLVYVSNESGQNDVYMRRSRRSIVALRYPRKVGRKPSGIRTAGKSSIAAATR